MNLLFTDKTGTLTEGKMRLLAVAFGSGEEKSLGEVLAEEGNVARWMRLAFRLGTAASEGLDAAGRRCALGGSPTERALLESVLSKPLPRGYRKTGTLAFSSERKYSAISLEGEERMTLVMGAPERLLPFVTRALCANGQPCAYRPSAVEASIRAHTSRGERVLLLTRSEEEIPVSSLATGIRGSLLLVGILVLSDPLRREARASVQRLQGAGVQVVMITGDGKETATYLASQCGILSEEHSLVLSGDELAGLSDLQLSERLPSLAVVCRALPSDKSRLVRIAEERGLVTGMTGDGINDAPALRRADVGFAMGSGTQVAKDAGDVIVLDDNLASIVRAVLYGRTVFKSIRKFITLQLLMNFSAMAVTMLCPFFGIDSPVTVVQMLWINLIMDTLGGLAFAGEPPLEAYMREAPKRREEPILNRYMLHTILCHGAFTVGLCLYFLNSPRVAACFRPSDGGIVLLTAFFALFIFSSVFNCFGARTDRLRLLAGIRKNPVFLAIMVAVLAIQILFVYLGGSVLRTVPLTASELLVTGALSLAVIPAELCRKILWRLTKGKGGY
jgi:calcium-translocating P-type ATPase